MGAPVENHAAAVIRLSDGRRPADAALREYLSRGRGLGDQGRRSVSQAVFAYYRWLGWLDPRDPPQRQVGMALGLQERFSRDPSSVKAEALAARAVPKWLGEEMTVTPAMLSWLQREPVLWIRAKLGRTDGVAKALAGAEPAVLPARLHAPPGLAALRYRGTLDVHRSAPFLAGDLEIQDLSSQLVGHACEAAPGETWWDACCGEGGKTLHLSDLMRNKGLIWATDRSVRRLHALRKRTARSGAFNYRAAAWTGKARAPFGAKCDGVLVDAPCSGVGTWRRNPHARWTTQPADVLELAAVQSELLSHAAGSVKPGGRLVYSVCTLTRRETDLVADSFAASHPEFEEAPIGLAGGASRLALLLEELDANAMFIAAWSRKR